MLHKSIKFAYAAIVLFAVAVAFLLMQRWDEVSVTGMSSVVRINKSDNVSSGADVVRMLESFARENHINISRELDDIQHPDTIRHLYVVVGDPGAESASWLSSGYPEFSRNIRREVHQFRDLGSRDPGGYYYVFGPKEDAEKLLKEFSKLGFHGWQEPFSAPRRAVEMYIGGALLWCGVAMLLAVAVVIGSGVILNAKVYGVYRLHGHSFNRVIRLEACNLGVHLLKILGLIVPTAVAFLFVYNQLCQWANFTLAAMAVFGFFAAFAVAVHVTTLAMTSRTETLSSLRGELPATGIMVSCYAIRIPALLVALTSTLSMILTGGELKDQRAETGTWTMAGNAAYIVLNGSLGDETAGLEQRVGDWIRRSSEQGQVILSWREHRMLGRTPGHSPTPGTHRGDTLIVNSAYLREQCVLNSSGERITGPGKNTNTVRLLIPEQYWADRDAIASETERWLSGSIRRRSVRPPTVQLVRMRNGQSLFTYTVGGQINPDPRSPDPVVTVIPDGSKIISDVNYMAYATQNGIVFRDSDYVHNSVSEEGLSRYVLAVNPVAENAAQQYLAVVRRFRLQTFGFLCSIAVLVFTAIGVAIIYCRRYSQALFVKYICGWSFIRTYRPILVLESVISLLLVSWSAFQILSRRGRDSSVVEVIRAGRDLGWWEPAIAGAIGIGSIGFVVAALIMFNSRMVREKSSEA